MTIIIAVLDLGCFYITRFTCNTRHSIITNILKGTSELCSSAVWIIVHFTHDNAGHANISTGALRKIVLSIHVQSM